MENMKKKSNTCFLVSLSRFEVGPGWSALGITGFHFLGHILFFVWSVKVPVLTPKCPRLITDRMITRFTAWLFQELFSWLCSVYCNGTGKTWSVKMMNILCEYWMQKHKISHIFWAGAFQWQLALCRRSICTRSVARRRSIIGTPNVWQTKREFKRMN